MPANEVHSISNNDRDNKFAGVSSECTWGRRGWRAKEGDWEKKLIKKIGKIIDIVRKTTCCKDFQINQKLRDDSKMTDLEYMEWFINHDCYLNHTGRPQICFFKLIFPCASHNCGGGESSCFL